MLPPTVGALEEPIAQPRGVHAGDTTWLADTFVCVEVTVKITRTVMPKMTLRTVMKICESIFLNNIDLVNPCVGLTVQSDN